MGLSLAHALEYPGKRRLDRETYLKAQTIYYPGFTIGGVFGGRQRERRGRRDVAARPLGTVAHRAGCFGDAEPDRPCPGRDDQAGLSTGRGRQAASWNHDIMLRRGVWLDFGRIAQNPYAMG